MGTSALRLASLRPFEGSTESAKIVKCYTVTDNDTGESSNRNGGAVVSVSGSGNVTSATQYVTGINVSSPLYGTLTFSVTLTDAAGNVGLLALATAENLRNAAGQAAGSIQSCRLRNAEFCLTIEFGKAGGLVCSSTISR